MDDCRSEGPVTGEPSESAGADEAVRAKPSAASDTREGDVIQGLRSGLVFSLALWAVLLTVGALVFT